MNESTKMSPFDVVNILYEKSPVDRETLIKQYNPFMVNRILGLNSETLFYANEMNQSYGLSAEMQFDFYDYIIPKKKRWVKWPKRNSARDHQIALIKERFNYNTLRAEEVLRMVDDVDDFIAELEIELNKGGASKPKRKPKQRKKKKTE